MEIAFFLKYSIIFLGVLIYLIKPRFLFLFSLCVYPIYVPLVSWGFPVLDSDDFFSVIYSVPGYIFRMYLAIFIIEIFRGQAKFGFDINFFLPSILLCIYLLFHGLLFYQDFSVLEGEIVSVFIYLLPLILLSYSGRIRPLPKDLFYVVCFIIIIQVIFCYLNTINIYAYPIFYVQGFIWEAFEGLVTGTFARFNYLTNFLTTLYICIAIEFYDNRRISSFLFYTVSIIIMIITILSGSRMSLVLMLFILFGCNLLYVKRNTISLVIISVIVFSIVFLFTGNQTGTKNEMSGIVRQVSGLTSTIQKEGRDEGMTTILSIRLINNYSNNLIFGCGRSDKGENAYIKAGHTLDAVKADARLVYIIVEYGIVGFVIYMLFFYSIYYYMKTIVKKRDKKKIDFIFIYFLLYTITEMGIFDLYHNQIIYIYVFTFLVKRTDRIMLKTS